MKCWKDNHTLIRGRVIFLELYLQEQKIMIWKHFSEICINRSNSGFHLENFSGHWAMPIRHLKELANYDHGHNGTNVMRTESRAREREKGVWRRDNRIENTDSVPLSCFMVYLELGRILKIPPRELLCPRGQGRKRRLLLKTTWQEILAENLVIRLCYWTTSWILMPMKSEELKLDGQSFKIDISISQTI